MNSTTFEYLPKSDQTALTLEALWDARWSIREGNYPRAMRLAHHIAEISARAKGALQSTALPCDTGRSQSA
jgi:hypothetical protein